MILGIDHGEKRIGLAIADRETKLAVPVGTLTVDSRAQALEELGELVKERRVEEIVVGIPYSLDGNESKQTKVTLKFVEKLEKSYSIPVHKQDERFTTKIAEQGGSDRSSIDQRSAVIILQTYIDRMDA